MKELEKELAGIRTKQALDSSTTLISQAAKIGEISVIAQDLGSGFSGDDLRAVALDLRSKLKNSVVILASAGEEKITLVVATDEGARNYGAKAGALVKIGSSILGGGGGGKDDFAQGGGTERTKISEAFRAITAALS